LCPGPSVVEGHSCGYSSNMVRATHTLPPISSLPQGPGVYLFYGVGDALVYVGKSKGIRGRVRTHFREKSERWMMRRVRRVETRETAGELGALLLESKLIKELKPMFNVAQKQRRRIVIAERKTMPGGYVAVHLKAVDAIDPSKSGGILGVFKHTTQAKEFMTEIARRHRLCLKLLGLERPRTACFAYHLGACNGACIGEEPADRHNDRLEDAFRERRIIAWPYRSGIIVEEASPTGRSEMFLIDNWVLVGSLTRNGGKNAEPFLPGSHRFDYDTYKLLYTFMEKKDEGRSIREVGVDEWNSYVKLATGDARTEKRIQTAPPKGESWRAGMTPRKK